MKWGGGKILKEMMAKIFPNLMKTINPDTRRSSARNEENYIKAYHPQIAQNQVLLKIRFSQEKILRAFTAK